MRALILTERAIKNEPKETCSIVRKGHKIKLKQPIGDYFVANVCTLGPEKCTHTNYRPAADSLVPGELQLLSTNERNHPKIFFALLEGRFNLNYKLSII